MLSCQQRDDTGGRATGGLGSAVGPAARGGLIAGRPATNPAAEEPLRGGRAVSPRLMRPSGSASRKTTHTVHGHMPRRPSLGAEEDAPPAGGGDKAARGTRTVPLAELPGGGGEAARRQGLQWQKRCRAAQKENVWLWRRLRETAQLARDLRAAAAGDSPAAAAAAAVGDHSPRSKCELFSNKMALTTSDCGHIGWHRGGVTGREQLGRDGGSPVGVPAAGGRRRRARAGAVGGNVLRARVAALRPVAIPIAAR